MRQSKKSAKARQESQKRYKEATFEEDIKKPRPKTWSARMPAYAGTVLCVDRRYRPRKGVDTNGKESKSFEAAEAVS